MTDVERDRAILDWLRAGKTPGGEQTAAARRTSIRALAALGYDPAERAIYKRRRGR